MRIIKFRSWNKKTKKMNYNPTICGYESTCERDFVPLNEALAKNGDTMGGGTKIFMQYAGMIDKKGKEIYEGDIVKINGENSFLGEICFKKGCFQIKRIDSITVEHPIKDYRKVYEVIGNIYENKLLNNNKQIKNEK